VINLKNKKNYKKRQKIAVYITILNQAAINSRLKNIFLLKIS